MEVRENENASHPDYASEKPGSIKSLQDIPWPSPPPDKRGESQCLLRTEEKLRQSESQLAEAQRLAHVGSWSWDLETDTVTWSDELYRIFGLPPHESFPSFEAVVELVHPDDRNLLLDIVESALKTRQPFSYYCRIARPDGEERIINARGIVGSDEQGNPIRIFGAAQDVTERKRAEEALREAERKYRDIFDNAAEGIFQTSPEGKILTANPALARMLGFASSEELIRERTDTASQHYVDPKRRDELKLLLEEHGFVRGFEYQGYRRDGSKICLSNSVRAVRDGNGTLLYYEGIAEDVTERRRAEEALRKSEERYRELFENAKDAIYVHDLAGTYTAVNRAAEKLVGYPREEILGKNFVGFFPPEQLAGVRENLCRKRVDQGQTTYETEVIASDGRRVPIEVRSRLILENGVATGVQGMARDITERKLAEGEIKATNAQLRALSESLRSAREEEGARIARELHDELGSALTSLNWGLEEVDKTLSAGDPTNVSVLREKIVGMTTLVDTTIDTVRRISSELRPSVLDDLGLVEAVEWQAKQFQTRTGIICDSVCSLESVNLNRAQSTAVFRIFQEALTNILRHAEATKVNISVKQKAGEFLLQISDNGKGITESEMSGPQSLGLLGMKERAHLVGGEVSISGTKGHGTSVTVRVPLSLEAVFEGGASIDETALSAEAASS